MTICSAQLKIKKCLTYMICWPIWPKFCIIVIIIVIALLKVGSVGSADQQINFVTKYFH